MTIHWKAVEHYYTVVVFVLTRFVILENLLILDLTLSGVKGLNVTQILIETKGTFLWSTPDQHSGLLPFLHTLGYFGLLQRHRVE